MARYGKKSQESVEEAMHKMKRGKLKSGRSGKTVRNPKQAVAIGLSEARKKGAKVPPQPETRRRSSAQSRSSSTRASRSTSRTTKSRKLSRSAKTSSSRRARQAKSTSRRTEV